MEVNFSSFLLYTTPISKSAASVTPGIYEGKNFVDF